MSDIVVRLLDIPAMSDEEEETLKEAAAEIERMWAELDRKRRASELLRDAEEEIERLQAENGRLRTALAKAEETLDLIEERALDE
jgi:hypothetical protein